MGLNLIALHQPPVDIGSSALDDFRNEDSGPGLLADDGETEAAVFLLV